MVSLLLNAQSVLECCRRAALGNVAENIVLDLEHRIQHLIATSGLTLRKPLESSYPLLQVARSKGSMPAAAVQKATLHAKALRRKRPERN